MTTEQSSSTVEYFVTWLKSAKKVKIFLWSNLLEFLHNSQTAVAQEQILGEHQILNWKEHQYQVVWLNVLATGSGNCWQYLVMKL